MDYKLDKKMNLTTKYEIEKILPIHFFINAKIKSKQMIYLKKHLTAFT